MSTTQPPPTSGGGKVIASQLPDIDWGLAPVPDVGWVYPKRTFLAPDLTRLLSDSLPDSYRGLRGVSGAHGHVTKMSSPCGLLITAA